MRPAQECSLIVLHLHSLGKALGSIASTGKSKYEREQSRNTFKAGTVKRCSHPLFIVASFTTTKRWCLAMSKWLNKQNLVCTSVKYYSDLEEERKNGNPVTYFNTGEP